MDNERDLATVHSWLKQRLDEHLVILVYNGPKTVVESSFEE